MNDCHFLVHPIHGVQPARALRDRRTSRHAPVRQTRQSQNSGVRRYPGRRANSPRGFPNRDARPPNVPSDPQTSRHAPRGIDDGRHRSGATGLRRTDDHRRS